MVHGRNLIVQTASGGLLAAKSCEIETEADVNEVSSTSSSNFKKFMAGRKEWSIITNHLLPNGNSIRDVLSVGSMVTLRFIAIDPDKVIYFQDVVSAVPVENQTTIAKTPEDIYFHITNKYFVAYERATEKFYRYWPNMTDYSTPPTEAIYKALQNGQVYSWAGIGNSLSTVVPRLQGSAIVKRCRISGQVGSLAKGAFTFQGTGDLSWITT